MRRKTIFAQDGIYHLFNRTIAKFAIFNYENSAERFLDLIDYCNDSAEKPSFSKIQDYERSVIVGQAESHHVVKILAYSLMPNHYHLVLKQLADYSVSEYLGRVDNSMSKYVNQIIDRKGPLWESRFKSVQINSEEQLKHSVRYTHLNPTTDNLVSKPEDWKYSSYRDFISGRIPLKAVSELAFGNIDNFRRFHENQIDYQRSLKRIKKALKH